MKPGYPIQFSPDRSYRYTLWREWLFGDGYLMVIGLNPSTADETKDDPTIRRCINFAKDWGYSGLCMTNLFAFRATKPADMKRQHDPVGIENDRWLIECGQHARLIVAAWGLHGDHRGRDQKVKMMFPDQLHCFRLTEKTKRPEHPLYLPKTLTPVRM